MEGTAAAETVETAGADRLSDHAPSPVVESTDATIERARREYEKPERPAPQWVRGKCPLCQDDVVSNCYYVGGRGYLILLECWGSLGAVPTCDYRKVL